MQTAFSVGMPAAADGAEARIHQARIHEARILFQGLLWSDNAPPDLELSQSASYRRFLKLGLDIRRSVSRDRFSHVMADIAACPDLPAKQATACIEHLWAGLHDMPCGEDPRSLH